MNLSAFICLLILNAGLPPTPKNFSPGGRIAGITDTVPAARRHVKTMVPSIQKTVTTDTLVPVGKLIPSLDRGSCKGQTFVWLPGAYQNISPESTHEGKPAGSAPARTPILQVHGNVLYELNYRSFIDTPYSDREVYQHMIQAYLDITYKDNYPFRLYLTNRWSNSPLLRHYGDIGLAYNKNDFAGNVQRQALALLARHYNFSYLDSLRAQLAAAEKKLGSLRKGMDSLSAADRIVGGREDRWLAAQNPGPKSDPGSLFPSPSDGSSFYRFGRKRPAANPDSSAENRFNRASADTRNRFDSLKARVDSLETEAGRLFRRYQQAKAQQEGQYANALQQIRNNRSGKGLADSLRSWGISDSSLPKGYRTLLAVRSFGIGRSVLDYSELSAKNVSINGLQLEYNPGSYWAFALGSVDYRFRDFVASPPAKGQYIGVVRYGKGIPEGNHIIGTWYTGKRQLYNAYTDPQTGNIPNYQLMGFTLEARYQLNRNSYLIAEAAKSSLPYYSLDSTRGHRILGTALNISDHSNEAWSVQLNTFIPVTRTQLAASYQHFGANFQSFSLYTNGVTRSSWKVMADQPFFNKQLLVRAGIRTNDFSNMLTGTVYESSTLFATLQATLRIRKWPVLQVGYYPSSQLLKTGDNHYEENLFYTLSASASHTYRLAGVQAMSLLLYTRFYNQQRDSGLVYYNTQNIQANQTVFFGSFTCQLQGSAALSASYNLYVIDGRLDWRCRKWLSLGGGLKYNEQTVYDLRQWGYSGNITIRLTHFGEVQMMADKGFLPGSNRHLIASNIGRLTYFKTF